MEICNKTIYGDVVKYPGKIIGSGRGNPIDRQTRGLLPTEALVDGTLE